MINQLEELAVKYGFDDISFIKPYLSSQSLLYYNHIVDNNLVGDMKYLARNSFFRNNPLCLVPYAKSVIVLAVNYYHESNKNKDFTISKYAFLNQDYHVWFKKKLKEYAKELQEKYICNARIFLDTSPVMEKLLAANGSIGWQGKHSCIVSRKFAGWMFLGFVFTDLEIEAQEHHKDHCGKCSKCLVACPTNAIKNYKLDIEKCISYYNIEHKGFIKEDIALKMGDKIFGCDDCLNACIWNKFSKPFESDYFSISDKMANLSLKDILVLNNESFLQTFNKTPIKRLGIDLLKRNAVIVALNTKNQECLEVVKTLTNSKHDILRQTAIWALEKSSNK